MNNRGQFKRANGQPGKGRTGTSPIIPQAAAPSHYHCSRN